MIIAGFPYVEFVLRDNSAVRFQVFANGEFDASATSDQAESWRQANLDKIPTPPSDDSLTGRTVLDLLSPEDRAAVEATLEKSSPRVADAIQAIRLLANAPLPEAQ